MPRWGTPFILGSSDHSRIEPSVERSHVSPWPAPKARPRYCYRLPLLPDYLGHYFATAGMVQLNEEHTLITPELHHTINNRNCFAGTQ